jgi:glutamate synthase domain-containing protein 3
LLRTRFAGNPEMIMAYFSALATEVRVLLATLLGARTIEEIVGLTERLRQRRTQPASDWMQALLQPTEGVAGGQMSHKQPNGLARQLAGLLDETSELRRPILSITNADLSVGAHLSGEVLRRWGGLPDSSETLDFEFRGTAGQSFGAFLVSGIQFRLWGDANDYVGKGLSGGSIAISAGAEASRRGDVLAGNTLLYGATSGKLYIAGRAGERFAVRNSGALAVVEGVGDHGCEYMTGGVVLVLGPIGVNFGSGMTGGLAYVAGEHIREHAYNREFVRIAPCSAEEEAALRQVLTRHLQLTGSLRAASLLNSDSPLPLVRVQPAALPCSVQETWKRVWGPLAVANLAVEASMASAEPLPLSY